MSTFLGWRIWKGSQAFASVWPLNIQYRHSNEKVKVLSSSFTFTYPLHIWLFTPSNKYFFFCTAACRMKITSTFPKSSWICSFCVEGHCDPNLHQYMQTLKYICEDLFLFYYLYWWRSWGVLDCRFFTKIYSPGPLLSRSSTADVWIIKITFGILEKKLAPLQSIIPLLIGSSACQGGCFLRESKQGCKI